MSTIDELRARSRQQYTKIDPNGKIRDNNILDFFVNEGYSKVQSDGNYDFQECEDTYTFTISWAGEYNLPTGFVRLTDIKANWVVLQDISKQDTIGRDALSATPNYYYLFKKQIGFYPYPTGSDTVYMVYKKKLPKLTATQDSELDEDYDEAISLYACYLMCLSVEKVQKAQIVLAQYKSKIADLFGMWINNDETITFGLQRT